MANFSSDFRRHYRLARNHVQKKGWGGWRFYLNVCTIVLLIIIFISARKEIVEAFKLLSKTNIWLILLLIPLQFASYYANTEVFFTYLRSRGQLRKLSALQATGMSLEFSFVNHVFPSAGISGASYMVWRLSKYGVSSGQATLAQIMRLVVQFGTFMVLMAVALVWATMENRTANWVVVATAISITTLILVVAFGNYVAGSKSRINSFSHWLSNSLNKIIKKLTFGRSRKKVNARKLDEFFFDLHSDYSVMKADKNMLKKPIIWSFIFNILDVALFFVAFCSLGEFVNPAILLIAYGAATLGGGLMVTPGGIGAYEVIMVGVLVAGGVSADASFAGVILTRMLLLVGTISTGFIFYQRALNKYGKPTPVNKDV